MGKLDEVLSVEPNAEQPAEQVKPLKRQIKKMERLGKKTNKKAEMVMVQYLTAKRQVFFKGCKIVSGNLVVIDNKVHELNPKKIWIYNKTIWYIVREIDRKPVSNEDYDAVVARGDDTDSDVPLIKAVLGAIQKQNIEAAGKMLWIILGIAVVGVVAFLFLYKGG